MSGFVGRQAELHLLRKRLDRVITSREGAAIAIRGRRQVGKSRLVAEAVERAAAAGFTVLVGRCLDTAESALPYLPFTEIVGSSPDSWEKAAQAARDQVRAIGTQAQRFSACVL